MKKTLNIFFCLFAFSIPANAQDESQMEHMAGRLMSAHEGTGNLLTLDMGLDLTLEDGWYTYWKMPGDSGVAPAFDWSGSTNVKNVAVSWPTPKRFAAMDMYSFGYERDVIFPLVITPEKRGEPIILKLKLDTVICHDICIPATLNLEKTLENTAPSQSADFKALKEARTHVPAKENTKLLGMDTAVIGKDSVVVTVFSRNGFGDGTDLVIQTPQSSLTAPPEIIADEKDKQHAVLKIHAPKGMDLSKLLFGKTMSILLVHGDDAIEKDFTF